MMYGTLQIQLYQVKFISAPFLMMHYLLDLKHLSYSNENDDKIICKKSMQTSDGKKNCSK